MTSLRRPLTQLAAFAVAGAISAVLVVNTLSVPVQGTTVSHTAEFTGVEGLRSGNDVTISAHSSPSKQEKSCPRASVRSRR